MREILLLVGICAAVPCDDGTPPFLGETYSAGQQCVYDGHLWKASWSTNTPPEEGDPAWKDLGACDSYTPPSCSTYPTFSLGAVYDQPTAVLYNNAIWRNGWWASGEVPSDTSGNWLKLYDCSDDTSNGGDDDGEDSNGGDDGDDSEDSSADDVKPTKAPKPATKAPEPATKATKATKSTKTPKTKSTKAPKTKSTKAEKTKSTKTSNTKSTKASETKATKSSKAPDSNPDQVRPDGPVGPNNECVWPKWVARDYKDKNSYVGIDDKVYANAWYAAATDQPPASPWSQVATCVGSAPDSRPSTEDLLASLGGDTAGLKVVYDPWTPFFKTDAEAAAVEDEARQTDGAKLVIAQNQLLDSQEVEKIAPGRTENPSNVKRVESIISAQDFDAIAPVRNVAYTYENFLKAVGAFPAYCGDYNDGRDAEAICRKLLATSFAHGVQETGANWPTLTLSAITTDENKNPGASKVFAESDVIPQWNQAFWYLREMGHTEDSGAAYTQCGMESTESLMWSLNYPCADNKGYFGRGSKQLSWNYNYGLFSKMMFGDANYLLENPALVADTWLNWASGIFFAVTPQAPKPSMLSVLDGSWVPNSSDKAAGLSPGFGATIMIINGGLECGKPGDTRVANRVNAYKKFAEYLKVPVDESEDLDCSKAQAFPKDSAGATPTYWTPSWTPGDYSCNIGTVQTPFILQYQGDYLNCINFYFRSHWFKDGVLVSDYGRTVGTTI